MQKVEYFFEPNRVHLAVEPYVALQEVFQNPDCAGQATVIAGVRKSPICLFDWLGGYDFQTPLCQKVNLALTNGWISKRDACTSDIIRFESLLTEVDLMVYYDAKGYTVSRPPQSVQNHRADLLVSTSTDQVCIEVYHPRVWAGYEAFRHEMEHHVRLMDVPHNYSSSFHYEQINRYRKNGSGSTVPYYFDPYQFSKDTASGEKRWEIIQKILANVDPSILGVDQEVKIPELNMRIVIRFWPVTPPDSRLIFRGATMVPFGLSMPANSGEWMFDRMLRTSIAEKIRKKQAHTVAGVKTALVVDCSYFPSFLYDNGLNDIERLVNSYRLSGLVDTLAFCKRNSNSDVTFLWTKSKDPNDPVIDQLFS